MSAWTTALLRLSRHGAESASATALSTSAVHLTGYVKKVSCTVYPSIELEKRNVEEIRAWEASQVGRGYFDEHHLGQELN